MGSERLKTTKMFGKYPSEDIEENEQHCKIRIRGADILRSCRTDPCEKYVNESDNAEEALETYRKNKL